MRKTVEQVVRDYQPRVAYDAICDLELTRTEAKRLKEWVEAEGDYEEWIGIHITCYRYFKHLNEH